MNADGDAARSSDADGEPVVPDAEQSIGVVIPAYEPDVSLLESYVDALEDAVAPAEIVIELDAPGPGVEERLAPIATVSTSADRRGKGRAIMDGFDALETDVLVFADADGSVPATSIAAIASRVIDGASLAVGSRRHPDATIVTHQTIGRRVLGDAFALVARHLLPVALYDYQCGAKAVTRSAWDEIRTDCSETGFAWDVEFVSVAALRGFSIAEVPVEWRDHPDSTVDPLSTGIELLRAIVDVRRRARGGTREPGDRTGVNTGPDDD